MPWLFWLSLPTLAGAVDKDEIQQMVDELVVEVESRAGRTFVIPPRAGIAPRERLRPALLRRPVEILPPDQDPPAWSPSEEDRQRVEYNLQHALAVYVPSGEWVYVVKEAIEEVFDDYEMDPEALRPLLRCVLVHELVHTLQHQYGVEREEEPDAADGLLAVREGHASLVADAYCTEVEGGAIAQLMDVVQGIELLANLSADDMEARYGWGRLLASALHDEDLVWSALIGPAPRWTDIAAGVAPAVPQGWGDPAPLVSALDGLDLGPMRRKDPVSVSPTQLLVPFLDIRPGIDPIPRAEGGWLSMWDRGVVAVTAAAFLLAEAGDPATLVRQRRAAVQADPDSLMLFANETGSLIASGSQRPLGQRAQVDGVVDTLQVRTRTQIGGRYTEYWVATDRRLVILSLSGTRIAQRQAIDAALRVLDALPASSGTAGDLAALGPWLEGVRQAAPQTPTTSSWQYRLQQAADGLAAGREGACSHAFAEVLVDDQAVPDPVPYARAALYCAAARSDFHLADAALAWLDTLDPTAIYLAWGLIESDRPSDALEVLDRVVADGEVGNEIDHCRLAALIALRRWPEVATLVRQATHLPPQVRAYAASELFIAGRRSQGRAILVEVCPLLSEEEQRECASFIAP